MLFGAYGIFDYQAEMSRFPKSRLTFFHLKPLAEVLRGGGINHHSFQTPEPKQKTDCTLSLKFYLSTNLKTNMQTNNNTQ